MSAQPTGSVRQTPSNNLNRQVGLYSLAAGAAGVTMLALAQPAAGEVVITRKTIPIPLTCGGGVSIDMNHDGITDFKLYAATSRSAARVSASKIQELSGTFMHLPWPEAQKLGRRPTSVPGPSPESNGQLVVISTINSKATGETTRRIAISASAS